jgi:hypothetical protein
VNFFLESSKKIAHMPGVVFSKNLKKIKKALDWSFEVPAPVFLNAHEFVPITSFIDLS